jgi:hypothetical protein
MHSLALPARYIGCSLAHIPNTLIFSHACDAVKGFIVDKKRTFNQEFDDSPSPQRHRNHVRLYCWLSCCNRAVLVMKKLCLFPCLSLFIVGFLSQTMFSLEVSYTG